MCLVVSSCRCSCLTHVTSRWLVMLVVHSVRDRLRHVTSCHLDCVVVIVRRDLSEAVSDDCNSPLSGTDVGADTALVCHAVLTVTLSEATSTQETPRYAIMRGSWWVWLVSSQEPTCDNTGQDGDSGASHSFQPAASHKQQSHPRAPCTPEHSKAHPPSKQQNT